MTEITVAPMPAPSAMSSDSRVPKTSCEKMSWPVPVVPRRCAREGCSIWPNWSDWGSYGAITGARIARRTKKPNTLSPASALRLRVSARSRAPAAPRRPETGGALTGTWSVTTRTAIGLALLPRPRIQQSGQHVGREDREEDRERDHQEQGLHQRVVLTVHRLQEREAEA